jgi:uncharacterized SAM-binding protein YcdF (DUF218 family)
MILAASLLCVLVGLAALVRAGQVRSRRLALLAAAALGVVAVLALRTIEVRKLAGLLLMPVGLVWLGLGAFVLAPLLERDLRRTAPRALLLAFYTLSGNLWVGSWLTDRLQDGIPVALPTGHLDAVFVLGGGTSPGPHGGQLNGSSERLRVAELLYQRGVTPLLVSSGSSIGELEAKRSLADETAAFWKEWGVPAQAIVTLDAPELINTDAELRAYQAEKARRGWARVGLVSSAWHLPRALRICKKLGLEVVPIAADFHGGDAPTASSLLSVVPQLSGFGLVQGALWEGLGMLKDG